MLAAGETTFTYDANGNRISKHDSKSETFYEYNYDNLLTRVSTPDKDTTYGYDSLNRRILKSSRWDWDTVSYIYDGLDVIQEVTGYRYHQKVTTYYRANGMIVASQRYVTNGASSYFGIHRPNSLGSFYAYDGLGSVAGMSNYRGWAGSSRYEYDAFGSMREGSLKKNPYGFTGKRFDSESGLYHFHFRKYDPTTGVWTTPDPIDIVGGLNLYGYVRNNPVIFIDPWGLCAGTGFWDSVGAIGRGILIAGQGTWNALGSEVLQEGTLWGFTAAGKITAINIAFVGVKTYAIFDVATGGPVTTVAMVYAGTPQGQSIINEFTPSMNPGTAPSPTFPYGFFGWVTGTTIETILSE